ncbi:MAG TPA: hypothetical protein VG796_17665 [Verrucomicrobiales bacterium]|jgi:hypothetical protein|nr:hypothetical protein [Verrucomicrobiales bacterium]
MTEPAFNPYAAPQSTNLYEPEMGDICRRGPLLVVPRYSAAYLPCDTCVKCGRPAVKTLRRTLSWHHPGLYLILISPLIYVIVALIVRKQLRVTVGLCTAHASKRSNWIMAGWLTFLAAIGLFFVAAGVRGNGAVYGLSGGGLLVISLIIAVIASNLTVRPRRITQFEGTLAGAGEGYLQQFPVL